MIAHFGLPFGATAAIDAGHLIFTRRSVGGESRALLGFRLFSAASTTYTTRLHLLFYAGRMRLTWPLVAREKEMRLIEAALTDPDASGIVISGSAGVGKSRVAREALDAAASRGCEVRWVVGTSCGRGLPLGALLRATLLDELVDGGHRARSSPKTASENRNWPF